MRAPLPWLQFWRILTDRDARLKEIGSPSSGCKFAPGLDNPLFLKRRLKARIRMTDTLRMLRNGFTKTSTFAVAWFVAAQGAFSSCAQENQAPAGKRNSAGIGPVESPGTGGGGVNTTTTGDGDQNKKPPVKPSPTPKPQVMRYRITFPGSKGDTVPGYLWRPPGAPANKKHPAVIVMYGISGDKNDGGVALAADMLAKAGFLAMTLDWPGTGERMPPINDRISNSSVKDWTVADYGAALNWLSARPDVDPGRIGYAGASMGAMTGLAFAKKDARVKAFVAIVPLPNPLWGGDAPESTIKSVAPRPLLCIMASEDKFGPSVCNNAGAGSEKLTVPGGHEPPPASRQQIGIAARDFFIRHLRP